MNNQINILYQERYKIFITLWYFYITVCHIQSEHWWVCYIPGALCSCYSFLTSAVAQIL